MKDSRETDEFRETYQLSPGFNVDVSNIRGVVDIQCHDSDEAQVHIVSHAGLVEVGRLNRGLNVYSVSGPFSASIVALDENGVHIKV